MKSSLLSPLLALAALLWLENNLQAGLAQGPIENSGIILPENTSTNYSVTTPGIVSIAFNSDNEVGYSVTGQGINLGEAPQEGNHIQSIAVSNNTTGQVIAYLDVMSTINGSLMSSNGTAGFVVSGLGSSVSFNGTFNYNGIESTLSYASGSLGAANASLSGTGTMNGTPSGTYTGIHNLDSSDYDVEYSTSLYGSGVFSFYAPTAGTYTITEQALGDQDNVSEASGNYTGQASSQITQYISISSITNVPASSAPSGSIRVNKIEGGAGGVNIIWTITPPQ